MQETKTQYKLGHGNPTESYHGFEDKISRLPHFLGFLPGIAAEAFNAYNRSNAHTGSWGTKDFGLSELVGKAAAAPSTNQGGSNLFSRPSTQSIQGLSTQTPTSGGGGSWGTTTTTPSGGGGGGTSELQKLASMTDRNPVQESEYQKLLAELQGGQDQTNRLIDEAYGASAGYLNQAEGALRQDFPTILSDIDAQMQAGLRTAGQGRDSSLGQAQVAEESATLRNQNVMADARRMYDELRRGYGQRFGGASSAGQAATEISNYEQQRQTGRTQQEFNQTLKQIETKRVEINQAFENQKFQLEQTKNQAVNEANRDFQNKLLQISQSRAENEQAKAQARLQALQDLRNKVYQINLQNLQFQQTLASQKQQQELGLNTYATQLGEYGQDIGDTLNSFNPNIDSNLQTSGGGSSASTNPYIGSISDDEDKVKSLFGNFQPTSFGI